VEEAYADAYIAFFPQAHCKILVEHHDTPKKERMCRVYKTVL